MSEAKHDRSPARSRWQRVWDSPAFLAALYSALIIFQAISFRRRLFFSADWRYLLMFVAYSLVMLFLFVQSRKVRAPKRHMDETEFSRHSLRSALLLTCTVAVYNLFEDYSEGQLNLDSVVGTAFACALIFVISAATMKNPPGANEDKPLQSDGTRTVPQA